MTSYPEVACHARTPVGERFLAVLCCERRHERRVVVREDAWQGGLDEIQARLQGSLCPICGDPERIVERVSRRVYDTDDGELHPGDMYWVQFHHGPNGRCDPQNGGWENCSGRHLHVVLPNGNHWDIDNRAGNCTLPEDGVHRCWVRHGDPPQVTVDKNGTTCKAGRGSVKSGDYHGYLIQGVLIPVDPSNGQAHPVGADV